MGGIGKKMQENPQLNEFVERTLSFVFSQLVNGEIDTEDICDGLLDATEHEVYWMFKQLGYDKEDYIN